MKRGIKKFLEVCCVTGTILIGLAFIAFVAYLLALGMVSFAKGVKLRPADLPADTPSEGVAWVMPEAGEVPVWMSPVCAGEAETAVWLDSYTEGDGPAPEWWNPDEPMSAVWVEPNPTGYGSNPAQTAENEPLEPRMTISAISDNSVDVFDNSVDRTVDDSVDDSADGNALQSDTVDYNPHPPVGIDPGGVDWNLCTTVWGWDGHGAEAWELDLYARIVYLEFWGTSPECCEAGADSILRLWESGYFGDTLGGVLSARAENGALVYTTYGFVWDAEYDPDGLAEIRELCEERFMNGPEWGAEFFQLYGFPEWAVPCYEIDGVYFSTGKGWN